MARIEIDYLSEPSLQFGGYFEHEDTKTGLAEYGPFGKNIDGLHVSEIRIGLIGTRLTIAKAKEWLELCSGYIESENLEKVRQRTSKVAGTLFQEHVEFDSDDIYRLDKILNRDFIGFNLESTFSSRFQLNKRWERNLDPRDLDIVLKHSDKRERIERLVNVIDAELRSITQTDPPPDIVLIALTTEIEEEADTVKVSGNFYLNLRRAIKARAMNQAHAIPVQIIRESTLSGRTDLQEVSIRAWNFCTAQYYKAGGVPWVPTVLERDTCFVGISFYLAQDVDEKLTMRSSVAQAFDYLGEGLVLRGEPFEWDIDKLGRTPHLTQTAARALIMQTLEEYINVRGNPPSRVVVHKTSEFWGNDRDEHNEIDGLYEGIGEITQYCETDLVSLRQQNIRLFREGQYPPLRGTYFTIGGEYHLLYTMGFIPYLETYPRPHVPRPWQITQHIGGSAPKDLLREILALTKMNVNNCNFADGAPITISFSRKVGEIMKHVSPNETVQPNYRFYM